MISFETIIVGLGVVGSACAAEFSERGRKVLGVEQSQQGCLQGSSGGGSKLLREFHPGRPDLAIAARESRRAWLVREAQAGRQLFVPTGGLAIGSQNDPAWMRQIDEVEESSIYHRLLDRHGVAKLAGWVDSSADATAVYEPAAGLLLAGPGVSALVDVAVAKGAELRFGMQAERDKTRELEADRPVLMRLNGEVVAAERVLYCTGPWTPSIGFADGILGLWVERAVQHWTKSARAAGICSESSPFVTWSLGSDQFCVVPWIEEQGLKFGRFGTGQSVVAEDLDRGVDVNELRVDKKLLGEIASSLIDIDSLESAVCMYTHAGSGLFSLQKAGPRVYILSACEGRGFKFAPLVARRVADCLFGPTV